ncbi:MAG: tRNA (N(6)-L-threonylcarbamoyladenosine(37)-C(2))-methylthiotransferase [Candidatus Altiarchaeota archaeon]
MEILTFGCAVNQADSEAIKGLLKAGGLDKADVVVVNTCTVKSPTENKILKRLRQLRHEGKAVVVAGCIPPARPGIVDEFPNFSFVGVNTEDIVEAVRCAVRGERYVNIASGKDKTTLPCIRENPVVGIVPICEGCLGGCSYCQTKFARGELKSYPIRGIVNKVKGYVEEGAREIWITAQDTGAYGQDIGSSLPELFDKVVSVDGDFKVRVGMMNPDHARGMLDELVRAYENYKIYKFLHLPVQSGDDRVLRDMGRRYTVEEFKTVVDAFRKLNVTLSTDVIVGYPTEDEKAFRNTVELVEEVKPDVLNVSRYWPRPGTKAAKLKQHPGMETKRRSGIMSQVFKSVGLGRNSKWIGWCGNALVSEANVDGTFTARNDWYKPIVIKDGELGENVKVEVKKATYYDLRGKVVSGY